MTPPSLTSLDRRPRCSITASCSHRATDGARVQSAALVAIFARVVLHRGRASIVIEQVEHGALQSRPAPVVGPLERPETIDGAADRPAGEVAVKHPRVDIGA